jgi:hypothetical protein
MKQMQITTVCDRCGSTVPEGSELGVTLGSNAPVVVDVCDACRAAIDEFLLPVLRKGVRPQNGQKRTAVCQDCGKTFRAGAGMKLHRIRMHKDEKEEAGVAP